MDIEKKPSNPEIGKAKILETLKAFQMEQQQVKEEPSAEVVVEQPSPQAPVENGDADVFRFAETLKQARQQQVKPVSAAGSLDAMAQRLLNVVYCIDPAWEQRDSEVANEWGLSPAQRVIRYCMLIFDQQLHQNVVHGYDFAEIGAIPAVNAEMNLAARMEAECPQCHKTFTRKVPGQICCSNECGDAYFPKPERKEPVFDDNFERFIESQNNPDRVPPVDPIRGPGMPVSGLLR